MNKITVVIGSCFLLCLALAQPLQAIDTGWLQAGVRVWYVGGTDFTSATGTVTNVEEADLIDTIDIIQATVIRQQAQASWTNPQPTTTITSNFPLEEGPFWINPYRLGGLIAPLGITWLDSERLTKSRTFYTLDTIPFLKTLPIQDLFAVRAQREIVILKNKDTEAEFYFDVETGLLLCKTEGIPGAQTMMTLSEINYNFATQTAFAEDNGPHSAYLGYFKANYPGFGDNKGFLFTSLVFSRNHNLVFTNLYSKLQNINSGLTETKSEEMLFDGDGKKAYIREKGQTQWTQNGQFLFWWVPVVSLTSSSIEVWNTILDRGNAATGYTNFITALTTAKTAFTSLTLDKGGFLTDAVLSVPQMFMTVKSADDPDKIMKVDGRSYYENQMKQAIPSGSAFTPTPVPTVTPTGGPTPTPTPTPGGCSEVGTPLILLLLLAGLSLWGVKQ